MERKQIPQTIENVVNSKHRMERLERLGMLAKQVLSQLSYTPTVRGTLILTKAFPFVPHAFPSPIRHDCARTVLKPVCCHKFRLANGIFFG